MSPSGHLPLKWESPVGSSLEGKWAADIARCLDTFAPSHLPSATREAGAVAALAERSKQEKYAALNQHHNFTPLAIETADPFGPETFAFLRELGCHLKQVTREAKSFSCRRSATGKCCCSDGNNGGHHLPF